ncbi:histidine kinase dimerization/phosphoacceptor domain-containing protein [Streptomyces sp. NPDC051183]|uniref:histidine kinase dimerization/phosphoacceptor domain-containing protein n=1 Tax=Streptomyces sp. NPDC051183 TaxID=3155165 RepID=UPI0034341749
MIGPGFTARTAGFACLLGVLTVLDAREWRIVPYAVFAARAVLLCAVTALDVSGLSRVLFVLVPFLGYFAFGPAAGIALGGGCVALLAGAFTLWVPQWQLRAEYISDLLMFSLGVVLALAMAAVAVREQRARARLEGTLGQVAELSAARERNRLAREIHDSLGHHLTAIGIQLETAEAFSSIDPAGSAKALSSARWSAGPKYGPPCTPWGAVRSPGRSPGRSAWTGRSPTSCTTSTAGSGASPSRCRAPSAGRCWCSTGRSRRA